MQGDQDLTSHSSLLFPCGAGSPYTYLPPGHQPIFAHSSVVWGRGQHRDAQGHPYHCSIQMGAKEKTRREGFSPPNMRMGDSGAAPLPQPLLFLTQLLFPLSQLPFAMRGAQHCLLHHTEKETRKLNATLSYCVMQSGCCTAQHHSLLCARRLRSAVAR